MLSVRDYVRWLQKNAAIRIFTHHETLVRVPREHCAAMAIGFYERKFRHPTS